MPPKYTHLTHNAPKYTHIYLTHNGAEKMWSYTTDVEERICMIVVFISSGHRHFQFQKRR